jgi:carbamoyltransferase
MNYVGISCGFHDAALSVVDDNGNILFAGHSERYSMKKHDNELCSDILEDAKSHITDAFEVHYYERPYVKAVRQFIAKQPLGPFNATEIIGNHNLQQLDGVQHIRQGRVKTHNHHLCHAAAGFQTSPFQDATVVVIDAIGELDTITIWNATYDKNGVAKYKKIWGRRYPDSIGLFYSAMTHRVNLRPLDEEYILMGMAAYGEPKYEANMHGLFNSVDEIILKDNLHIGVDRTFLYGADEMDIAASAQTVVEQLIKNVMKKARELGNSDNLVYGGGVALNCLANRLLGKYYQNIWIMPNPGDAGNSLGAAALGYGKKLNWTDAFLGFNIEGEYPVDNILKELYTYKMAGVASGRAEFGPRALGNRSLIADPRGPEIKDKVNDIKRRQQFRPFAPVVLEELVTDYFDMPSGWSDSRYMQVIATCRYPDLFPAIVHNDGTSRVQTVPNDGSGIRKLLEAWYKETGCPMLLNTSLNIRGEPMVNTRSDADRFEKLYGVTVCS